MLSKLAHAVTPVTVIVCSTVLLALGRIDSVTGVTLITVSAGYGAVAVGIAPKG